MAGPSKIILSRSEDATIDINVLARQANRTADADLTGVTVRLNMRTYPQTGIPLFTIDDGVPASGCTLDIIEAGLVRFVIPTAFWADKPAIRFSVECFTETPDALTRIGEVLIDVTD